MKPKTRKVKPITELRQEYNVAIEAIFDIMECRDKSQRKATLDYLNDELFRLKDVARSLDHQINQRIINANKFLNANR